MQPVQRKITVAMHKNPQHVFKLRKNFRGINYLQAKIIPPDTMGAASEKYIVSFVNNGFAVFDKTGKRLQFKTGDQFWQPLGTKKGQPAFKQFDPKVLYDQFSRRFIAVFVSGTKSKALPGSWLLIAISEPDNPFKWKHWAIEAERNTKNWADFPCLGLDQNHIYITANMFLGGERSEEQGDVFKRSKIWVISKEQLIRGAVQITPIAVFNGPKGSTFTTQPTHVFGQSKQQYLIGVASPGILNLNKIIFSGGKPKWRFVAHIKTLSYPNITMPEAPQKGSKAKIDTDDVRLLNALFRNGFVYTVHHVPSQDGKRTEVAWYQIDPVKKRVVQQGRIKDLHRFYYYPSIAVNERRDIVIGFSGSSRNEYASAYFTGRKSSDPLGKMRPISLLKKGNASYLRTDGGTGNRWGDYSATVVDPHDDSFWTVQEFVLEKNIYGTWWGNITMNQNGPKPWINSTLNVMEGK